jgi:hypothetical protein
MRINLLQKPIVQMVAIVGLLLIIWNVGPWSVKPVHAGISGVVMKPEDFNGIQITMGSANGSVTNPNPSTFTVPTTTPNGKPIKQVQVDQLTGVCNTSGGVGIQPKLETTANGHPSEFYPRIQSNPTAPNTAYSLEGPGPDFADPGSTMTFSNGQLGTTGSSSCTLLVTGTEIVGQP